MSLSEEEKKRISKIKASIELAFGKIKTNVKECNLTDMSRSMVRITDNARSLREQNFITSNEYLDIINRIDDAIDSSRNCKCTKI